MPLFTAALVWIMICRAVGLHCWRAKAAEGNVLERGVPLISWPAAGFDYLNVFLCICLYLCYGVNWLGNIFMWLEELELDVICWPIYWWYFELDLLGSYCSFRCRNAFYGWNFGCMWSMDSTLIPSCKQWFHFTSSKGASTHQHL